MRVGRHFAVAIVWLLAFRLLSEHAVRVIPLGLTRQLSLQAYLTLVQLAVLGIGLMTSFALLPEPRRALGLTPAALPRVFALFLAGPAIYVLASYAAIYAALPTLLAELAARGRQAVQESTGEFGRELVAAGLPTAVLWGVVVSPVAEELMFRGAVWSAAQSAVDAARQRFARAGTAPSSSALPEGVLEPSAALRLLRSASSFFLTGGVATAVSAGVFALMHADMPGGLGIVRWVSALGLGLAAGLARQASGGIAGPIVVHVVFNACALATTRRWLVTESFGQKLGVPILLSYSAAGAALCALAVALAFRGRRAPSS